MVDMKAMDKNLETLGLNEGATEEEIKRAYFRMVRKHSPEKDPEGFRMIREAYEALTASKEDQGPSFPASSDDYSNRIWGEIVSLFNSGRFEDARVMAEKAVKLYPEEDRYRYILSDLHIKCGNPGKAVKTSKKLIEKEPENVWYLRIFAICNHERGFVNQALKSYDRAYSLGLRESIFIDRYAHCCLENYQIDLGIKLIMERISSYGAINRENIEEYVNQYMGLLCFAEYETDDPFPVEAMYDQLDKALEKYGRILAGQAEELARIIYGIEDNLEGEGNSARAGAVFDRMLALGLNENSAAVVREMRDSLADIGFDNDDRIGEYIKDFVDDELNNCTDARIRRYIILNLKLCIMEDVDGALEQFEILERSYPDKFKMIEEFASELRNAPDREALRESYLEKMLRFSSNFDNYCPYFDEFPNRRTEPKGRGKVVFSGSYGETYVRATPKVGRNDPCPCGSGKKYKNCCG